jgi:hypothetical protein
MRTKIPNVKIISNIKLNGTKDVGKISDYVWCVHGRYSTCSGYAKNNMDEGEFIEYINKEYYENKNTRHSEG